MIARVEGTLCERTPTRVVVDVNGVGYELHVPLSTFLALPEPGKTVAMLVHTHVREDAILLYGFATLREKATFELLLRASRVGPKMAQSVLSGLQPDALLSAIRDGDVTKLTSAPGVGKKMAERLAVELRDKAAELSAEFGVGEGASDALGAVVQSDDDEIREQVLSALVNLGYQRAQAERVAAGAAEEAGPGASIETHIRIALQRLAR